MTTRPKPWEQSFIATPDISPPPSPPAPDVGKSGAKLTADGSSEDGTMNVSEGARREEIKKAVRFLTLESVRGRPLETKRAFLEYKGLAASQIDEAVREASLMAPPTPTPAVRAAAAAAATISPAPLPAATSTSASSLLLGGCIGTIAGGALAVASLGWRDGSLQRWLRGEQNAAFASAATPLTSLRLTLKSPPADTTPTAGASASATAGGDAASLLSPSLTPPPLATAPTPHGSRTTAALEALRALREEAELRAAQRLAEQKAEGSRHAEAALVALRTAVGEMRRSSLRGGTDDSTSGEASPASALHTLAMCLTGQLKHPKESRYHRLNMQNANLARLIALSGAGATLRALGFVEEEPRNGFWTWHGSAGNKLPTAHELEVIKACREELMRMQRTS